MSKTLEEYEKRFEPFDHECESGEIWRIRRMQPEDWGSIVGGFLILPKPNESADGAGSSPQTQLEQLENHRDKVFDRLVLGLVDPETRTLIGKPSRIDPNDLTEIVNVLWSKGATSGRAAELVGRSL